MAKLGFMHFIFMISILNTLTVSTVLSVNVLQELTPNYSVTPRYSKQGKTVSQKMVFATLLNRVHMEKLLRVTSD